ncbi:MAG: hypothetical protein JEZ03_15040 [Bacteroidales bacterium]|nr:hypothetical protein [Bacteroidales bacterium]
MKKVIGLVVCLTIFEMMSYSQKVVETTDINYGNFSVTGSTNIGIGTIPLSNTKITLKQGSLEDWLRFIPSGTQTTGLWRFHNPSSENKMHIGYRKNSTGRDYWNLTLTQSSQVGINDLTPEATLDVNGTVLFHSGIYNLMKVSSTKIVVGQGTRDVDFLVNGDIKANLIEVSAGPWADFVFADDYKLKPLAEVESFIIQNKHLPDVPSERKVKEEGINLGEMDAVLLQKIEELTLYLIQLEKQNKMLEKQVIQLKIMIDVE